MQNPLSYVLFQVNRRDRMINNLFRSLEYRDNSLDLSPHLRKFILIGSPTPITSFPGRSAEVPTTSPIRLSNQASVRAILLRSSAAPQRFRFRHQ
jgi:hypothetical protein